MKGFLVNGMQFEIRYYQKKYIYQCGDNSYALIDLQNLLENKSRVPLMYGNEHRSSLIKIANNLINLHGALFQEQLSTAQECALIDFLIARRLMKSAMPLHVLELGATNGILSFHLASIIGQYNVESSLCCVCSVDDSQWSDKVSKVENPPKLSRIIADNGKTELQSNKYDVVVINGNEAFTDADVVIREAKRLVNSNGIVICLEKQQQQLSRKFIKRFSKNEMFDVDSDIRVLYAESQKLPEENSDVPTEVKEMEDYLAEVRQALQGGTSGEQLRIYYRELEKHIDVAMQASLFDIKTKLIDCQDEVLNAMYPAKIEDNTSGHKIILSIGLLVSKGKETIQKCLESLTPFREQICCELIIVDTGCDANARHMLEGYADILKDFTWCNDFSKARNECLKFASGEWFLYLDDDEWLAEPEELIAFFKSGEYCKYGCASYIQRNFVDADATQYSDTWVARMVRRDDNTHFEGKIFEYLTPIRGVEKKLPGRAYHSGYAYPDEAAKRKHFERNYALLEEMIKEEPDQLRWRVLLLQEYYLMGDYAHVHELGEQTLKMTKECDTLCKAFLYYSLAKSCFFLGKYMESEENVLKYLEQKERSAGQSEDQLEQWAFPFIGECFDERKQKEVYSLLICDGLKRKDTEYLKQFLDCLQWNEQYGYAFEKMAESLIEAMCTMPRESIFEETILLMRNNASLWQYFVSEIRRWEAEGHEGTRNILDLIKSVLPEQQSDRKEEHAQAQLLELAEQIKERLRLLIANGMTEEAIAVIKQLQTMIPEDEELKELADELNV